MGYRGPRLRDVFDLETGGTPREIASAWGERARENVRERTPVGQPDPFDPMHRPGNLRESWEVRTYRRGSAWAARVSTGVSYAAFVEHGTSPHTIRAKQGKALRFQAGGSTVVARTIQHPGTHGVYMLARGISATRTELRAASRLPLAEMAARWRLHIREAGGRRR